MGNSFNFNKNNFPDDTLELEKNNPEELSSDHFLSVDLGETIKHLREEKRYTLGDFASKVEISISYLSLIENDKKKPSWDVLQRISSSLEMPLYVIFLEAVLNTTHEDNEVNAVRQALKPIFERIMKRLYADDSFISNQGNKNVQKLLDNLTFN